MNKPEVFNYEDYLTLKSALAKAEAEIHELRRRRDPREEPPEPFRDVLLYYASGKVKVDCRFSTTGYPYEELYGKVLFWLPLPVEPEREEENGA